MEKFQLEIFALLAILSVMILPFLNKKSLGFAAISILTFQVILGFIVSIRVFSNGMIEYIYSGSFITGPIPIRIDYLSAWFIIIISFTFLTGAWYGIHYLKKYTENGGNLAMHCIAFILAFSSLIYICIVQNGIVFLVSWEIMALSSFILIIFEHYKRETLKSGINFLIQSHISILFLTIAFIWVKSKSGSYDFTTISTYTVLHPLMGIGLFIFFFIGFAIKAGFVPFHTWLPLAHPAAPAHISGIMSGVIIKIGIYGILRMVLLIKSDLTSIGYFILAVSVITGLYGVMLAIVQHNLKRLLAYHSIENIGIIGIGIGLGCLGMGTGNQWLLVAGFGGALLHTLNHSLFKSLLFFSSGNVYLRNKTMNIELLGGLIKKMPHTAYLFLIGSLAICGLPPFNGFVSEFFIFSGLFEGLQSNSFMFIIVILFTILALVLIGGLALICFTKAFGIVFLGNERKETSCENIHSKPLGIIPLYVIALLILFIGIFPFLFSDILLNITGLFHSDNVSVSLVDITGIFKSLTVIGGYSLVFIVLIIIIFMIRRSVTRSHTCEIESTWGCGYEGDAQKMQYTASSFIRSYRKLFDPILFIKKEKEIAFGLYPDKIKQVKHPYDKIEYAFIDKPVYLFRKGLNRFVFLQNGNIRSYILYGFIFIVAAIILPVLFSKISELITFLNQL